MSASEIQNPETDGAGSREVQALTCPSCGGGIALRAAGYSTYYVCQYCSSELDLLSGEARLIAEHAQAADALHIPLGSKGVLKGIEWAVLGYLRKSDKWDAWDEYLLFNPYHGYRWLVFTKAGWSFGTPLLAQPDIHFGRSCMHEGRAMSQCFDFSYSSVDAALGEFYWQVKRGDNTSSASYVGGGRMLSCERSGDELNWTLEEWADSSVVAAAFGVDDTGQYPRIGQYPQPHQPNPYKASAMNAALIAGVFFLSAVLLVVVLSIGGETRQQQFAAKVGDPNREVSLGQFTIDGRPKPFTISTQGNPGNNNWLDVEYTLANVETGEEFIANQPVEYYFGRDWSEDNRSGTIKISGVPAGTYELTASTALPEDETGGANAAAGSNSGWSSGEARPVEVKATPNGIFHSHLLLLFFALFGPAVWIAFKAMGFEGRRASNYDGADDGDDWDYD